MAEGHLPPPPPPAPPAPAGPPPPAWHQASLRNAFLAALVPWWARFFVFSGTEHIEQFWADLSLARVIAGLNNWNPLIISRNIMGGWLPLSDSAIDNNQALLSEKAYTPKNIKNVITLLILEILFIFPGWIIASIPIVCALLPLFDLIMQLMYSDINVRALVQWFFGGFVPGPVARFHDWFSNEFPKKLPAWVPRGPFLLLASLGKSDEHCSVKPSSERWFFLNGMYNTEDYARNGRQRLGDLTRKHIRLLFRPSRGFFRDIWECYTGRSLGWPTIPAFIDRLQILKEIRDPSVKTVVIVGHSQGTIITAEIMEALVSAEPGDRLGPLSPAELKKVEITLLACCAARLAEPHKFRRVEIFGNLSDPVYQLSLGVEEHNHHVLRYTTQRDGHLLNAHYLFDFAPGRYPLVVHPEAAPLPLPPGGLYSYLA